MGGISSTQATPQQTQTQTQAQQIPDRGNSQRSSSIPTAIQSSRNNRETYLDSSIPFFGSPLSTPLNASHFTEHAEKNSLDEERNLVPALISWNQGGNQVSVTGSFTNWNHSIPLSRSRDDFTTLLKLPLGTHQFKFIVDGQQKCSNDFPTVPDAKGNLVNYVEITSKGFSHNTLDSVIDPSRLSLEGFGSEDDDDEYGQELPPLNEENLPPRLPPHLTNVILNSDPISSDPTVLPLPHHVMLNHLYALSIKDRIIVLASSSRYRLKYVTTVFYKPVFS